MCSRPQRAHAVPRLPSWLVRITMRWRQPRDASCRARRDLNSASGAADAVLAAKQAIAQKHDDILVIFADTPLVRAETLAKLRAAIAEGAAVAVLGFTPADPHG